MEHFATGIKQLVCLIKSAAELMVNAQVLLAKLPYLQKLGQLASGHRLRRRLSAYKKVAFLLTVRNSKSKLFIGGK